LEVICITKRRSSKDDYINRSDPDGNWHIVSYEDMTKEILRLRNKVNELSQKINELEESAKGEPVYIHFRE